MSIYANFAKFSQAVSGIRELSNPQVWCNAESRMRCSCGIHSANLDETRCTSQAFKADNSDDRRRMQVHTVACPKRDFLAKTKSQKPARI